MHTSSSLVILQIPLPRRDHRAFLAARRILVRIMGEKAPDTMGLIQKQLLGRDARGLADEYLDTVGWPLQGNRTVSLRRGREVRQTVQPKRGVSPSRVELPRRRGLTDPTRN